MILRKMRSALVLLVITVLLKPANAAGVYEILSAQRSLRGTGSLLGNGPLSTLARGPDVYAPQAAPDRISVVMLNWKRPANVLRILNKYVTFDAIEEIIVWMCNPATSFDYTHPKVRIIYNYSANEDFGLSTRFKGCLLAKSPWVLIQDDDHFAKEVGILKLMAVKRAHPERLVGTFGRDWAPRQEPAYSKDPRGAGPRPIVLTILMLTDKYACEAFWRYAPLVQDYISNNSKPLWNGEDIFFSLVSFKATGKLPLAVGAAKVYLPQQNTGIHFVTGHDEYRDHFLKFAVKKLELDYSNQTFGWPRGRRQRRREGRGPRVRGFSLDEQSSSTRSALAELEAKESRLQGSSVPAAPAPAQAVDTARNETATANTTAVAKAGNTARNETATANTTAAAQTGDAARNGTIAVHEDEGEREKRRAKQRRAKQRRRRAQVENDLSEGTSINEATRDLVNIISEADKEQTELER